VFPQPTALDRQLQAGAVFSGASLELEQKRPIDFFNMNAPVLRCCDRLGDFEKPV